MWTYCYFTAIHFVLNPDFDNPEDGRPLALTPDAHVTLTLEYDAAELAIYKKFRPRFRKCIKLTRRCQNIGKIFINNTKKCMRMKDFYNTPMHRETFFDARVRNSFDK